MSDRLAYKSTFITDQCKQKRAKRASTSSTCDNQCEQKGLLESLHIGVRCKYSDSIKVIHVPQQIKHCQVAK